MGSIGRCLHRKGIEDVAARMRCALELQVEEGYCCPLGGAKSKKVAWKQLPNLKYFFHNSETALSLLNPTSFLVFVKSFPECNKKCKIQIRGARFKCLVLLAWCRSWILSQNLPLHS